jgi:predicted nucleic acid-binding protein
MSVLLDTNVLTRLAQATHPDHPRTETAITALRRQGEALCIVPQNLYELWAVCTRPVGLNNGLGMSVDQTKSEIERVRTLFTFMPDSAAVFFEWERLVVQYGAKGKHAHDIRLIAAMSVHGIRRIFSYDREFSRYQEIATITPEAVKS